MALALRTRKKVSVKEDAEQVIKAIRLICRGARINLLELETDLSYERITQLYHEVQGKSPPKGMLPASALWQKEWHNRVHSTIFYGFYRQVAQRKSNLCEIDRLICAYDLYLDHVPLIGNPEALLSFMRAWTLIDFVNQGQLAMQLCQKCLLESIAPCSNETLNCPFCEVPHRVRLDALETDEPKAGQNKSLKSKNRTPRA